MKTKFSEWLEENGLNNKVFAERLATAEPPVHVSPRTVESWRYGRAMPRKEALKAIAFLSAHELSADDFLGSIQ